VKIHSDGWGAERLNEGRKTKDKGTVRKFFTPLIHEVMVIVLITVAAVQLDPESVSAGRLISS
jgi:hypothetical protein